jgi:plastocyanin
MKLNLLLVPVLALAATFGISSIAGAAPSAAPTTLTVNAGGGGDGIAANDFFPDSVTVHAGDTIHFVNPYEELHTTTFVPAGTAVPALVIPGPAGPPQFGINPQAANPTFTGTAPVAFDATKYYNSGLMFKGSAADVSFNNTGTFKFLCLFHTVADASGNLTGMVLDVKVIPASTTGADTQAALDARGTAQRDALISKGKQAASGAVATMATTADGSTNWGLRIGGYGDAVGEADIMRFLPSDITIKTGDTVTWTNNVGTPHTVTFTSGAALPGLVAPVPQTGGAPFLAFNPQLFLPAGGPEYDGTGYVNSGFLQKGTPSPTTFALKFTRPGTYTYACALHADQGMTGTITVSGPAAPAATPAAPRGVLFGPNTGAGPAASGGHGGWLPALLALAGAGALLALAGTRLARRSA